MSEPTAPPANVTPAPLVPATAAPITVVPPAPGKVILESAPSAPDDDFWLEQGRKMLTESLASVRSATEQLMKGLAALQALYLAILGFADFVPKTLPLLGKAALLAPLLCCLVALFYCLSVMKAEAGWLNLNAPDDIRRFHANLLIGKQTALNRAFGWFGASVVACFVVLFLYLKTNG